jgi:hypothetical protein
MLSSNQAFKHFHHQIYFKNHLSNQTDAQKEVSKYEMERIYPISEIKTLSQ